MSTILFPFDDFLCVWLGYNGVDSPNLKSALDDDRDGPLPSSSIESVA